MKKTLIALVAFTSLSLQAQIKPVVSLESGYSEKKLKIYYRTNEDNAAGIDERSFYADIRIGAKWNGFSLMTNTTTYFVPHFFNSSNSEENKWQSAPYLSVYDIDFSYNFGFMKVGAKHTCGHLSQSSQVEFNKRMAMSDNNIYIKINIINN